MAQTKRRPVLRLKPRPRDDAHPHPLRMVADRNLGDLLTALVRDRWDAVAAAPDTKQYRPSPLLVGRDVSPASLGSRRPAKRPRRCGSRRAAMSFRGASGLSSWSR